MAKTSVRLRALLASARIAVEDITVYARSNLEHGFVHVPRVVEVQGSVAPGIFGRANDAFPIRGILEQQWSGMRNPEGRSSFAAYSTLMRPGGRGRGGGIAKKRDGVGGQVGEQRMGADQSRDGGLAFGGAAQKGGRTGFLRRKEEERSSTSSRSATSSKGFRRRKEEGSSSSSRSATSSRQEWAGKRKSRQLDSQGKVRKPVKPRSFERIQNRSRANDEEDTEERRPKRRRHIMRLHRNDQTNKRIVEDSSPATYLAKVVASKEAAKPKEEEKIVTVPSQNALFRAIQPLPEILHHIESHLLGMRRLWEWRKGGYHTKLKAPLDDVPHGSKDGRLPIQETVFKRKLEFIAAAKVSTSLPSQALPEIAFAGRSNVGKSSLINALTRQWGVVRTSDKPGLTQSINFFTLGARLCLVDLPGYGFAYAKEETKEAWEDLVKEYVTTRKGLKRVCLLVDAKWGLKPRDDELIYLMENSSTKYQVVLTKTDVLSPIDLARRATQIQETLKHNNYAVLPVVMVSAQTGGGIPHLRKVLANLTVPL